MFKCGFYEKEITPPLGCQIPGYFNLRPGSDVKDRLYCRAMVLANGDTTVALLSIDGCIIDNGMIGALTDRIEKYTKIPASNVLIGYTHTHTGIPEQNCNLLKTTDMDAIDAQANYHDVFGKLMADCVTLAFYRMQDCTPEFAKGQVEGISFCRNYYMKNSTPTTNPPRTSPDIQGSVSGTDNDLPILFVKDTCGKPMGALISFACHPDCVDGTEYSGDYISEMSKQLKKIYGEDFVTLFLLGTCGNINHFDVSKPGDAPDHYRKMGRIVAGEALKALAKAEPLVGDTLICKKEYITFKRAIASDEQIAHAKHIIATVKEDPDSKIAADGTSKDQYDLAMAKILMTFVDTFPQEMPLPLQFIKIGDFELYAFPCEIFCQFGTAVKEGASAERIMVSSMCNASYGYVPTRDIFYDTIYESLPGSNKLDKEAGYMMAEKLIQMGKA